MNDIPPPPPPPPPYENTFSANATAAAHLQPTQPFFSLTKSIMEVKELIESLKSSASGQSFAIDDLKAQLATIQSVMERIEATNGRLPFVTTSAAGSMRRRSPKDQTLALTTLASGSGEPVYLPSPPRLPVETDEESYERICKILQGLISDASTAVKTDVEGQALLPTSEPTRVKAFVDDVFESQKDEQPMAPPENMDSDKKTHHTSATSRPQTLLSLLSPLSMVLQLANTVRPIVPILSTKPKNKSTRSETGTERFEEMPLSDRLLSYLRQQVRRTVYSIEPFVDEILLTPRPRFQTLNSSATTISDSRSSNDADGDRPTISSHPVSRTDEFVPPGIRGFLYTVWWSLVFAVAACLWDAELVKFAGGRVERIVTGSNPEDGRPRELPVPVRTTN